MSDASLQFAVLLGSTYEPPDNAKGTSWVEWAYDLGQLAAELGRIPYPDSVYDFIDGLCEKIQAFHKETRRIPTAAEIGYKSSPCIAYLAEQDRPHLGITPLDGHFPSIREALSFLRDEDSIPDGRYVILTPHEFIQKRTVCTKSVLLRTFDGNKPPVTMNDLPVSPLPRA